MNNQIIPTGPTEVLTDGDISKNVMVFEALTDCVITNLVFIQPPSPASGNITDSLTLKQGSHLFRIASLSFTGLANVIYTGN